MKQKAAREARAGWGGGRCCDDCYRTDYLSKTRPLTCWWEIDRVGENERQMETMTEDKGLQTVLLLLLLCVCVWRKSEEESVRSDMKGRSQNVFPREWKYFSQTEHGAFSYLSGPPIMHRLKCNSFHWRKRWAREGGDEGWKVLRRAEHSSVWSAGLAEEIRVGGWEKKARKQRGKLRR